MLTFIEFRKRPEISTLCAMPKRTANKPQKPATAKKRTAAQLHEAARVARRAGQPPEAVRALLDEASFAERAEARAA